MIAGEERGEWVGIERHLRAMAWSPSVSQRLPFFVSKERFEDLEPPFNEPLTRILG